MSNFDPVQFKSELRKSWNAASTGWKKWWPILGEQTQVVSDRLIDLAQVQAGHKVLDIATGIGEPAISIAHSVGSAGHVLAIDQAPQMLTFAKERMNEHNLQNIDFEEIDCEKLDLPESSFDAIVCRWGLMFMIDPPSALNRIYKVLSPKGYLSASVWADSQKVPSISLLMSVAKDVLQVPPPPKGTPGVFSLADILALEQMFTQAGFTNVHSEPVNVTFKWSSAEEFKQFTLDISAPITAMLDKHTPEQQNEFWQATEKAVQQYTQGKTIQMQNEAICVVGQK